jgi:hypothetical protein
VRTAQFNIERAQKAVTGQQWSIQARHAANADMAYFGPTKEAITGAASPAGAESICTMNNLFENLLLDAMSAEEWKTLALQFAATIVIKIPEGARCNACGLVNAHMPSCPVVPHLTRLRELHAKERT